MNSEKIIKAFKEMKGYDLLICWLIYMGYKQKEIAEELNDNLNNIKRRLFKLRERYRP